MQNLPKQIWIYSVSAQTQKRPGLKPGLFIKSIFWLNNQLVFFLFLILANPAIPMSPME